MYTIVKDGVAVCGASEIDGLPTEEMKREAKRIGGKIVAAKINKSPINPRMQMHGQYSTIVRADRVDYNYSVVEIPTETVRQNMVAESKQEAEKRILAIAPIWKQINAIADPDPEITAKVKAVRDASNALEAEIQDMDRDGLAGLVVDVWSGWPDASKTIQ